MLTSARPAPAGGGVRAERAVPRTQPWLGTRDWKYSALPTPWTRSVAQRAPVTHWASRHMQPTALRQASLWERARPRETGSCLSLFICFSSLPSFQGGCAQADCPASARTCHTHSNPSSQSRGTGKVGVWCVWVCCTVVCMGYRVCNVHGVCSVV